MLFSFCIGPLSGGHFLHRCRAFTCRIHTLGRHNAPKAPELVHKGVNDGSSAKVYAGGKIQPDLSHGRSGWERGSDTAMKKNRWLSRGALGVLGPVLGLVSLAMVAALLMVGAGRLTPPALAQSPGGATPGQYCRDQSGGQIFIPADAPISAGVNCGVSSGATPPAQTATPVAPVSATSATARSVPAGAPSLVVAPIEVNPRQGQRVTSVGQPPPPPPPPSGVPAPPPPPPATAAPTPRPATPTATVRPATSPVSQQAPRGSTKACRRRLSCQLRRRAYPIPAWGRVLVAPSPKRPSPL